MEEFFKYQISLFHATEYGYVIEDIETVYSKNANYCAKDYVYDCLQIDDEEWINMILSGTIIVSPVIKEDEKC